MSGAAEEGGLSTDDRGLKSDDSGRRTGRRSAALRRRRRIAEAPGGATNPQSEFRNPQWPQGMLYLWMAEIVPPEAVQETAIKAEMAVPPEHDPVLVLAVPVTRSP